MLKNLNTLPASHTPQLSKHIKIRQQYFD